MRRIRWLAAIFILIVSTYALCFGIGLFEPSAQALLPLALLIVSFGVYLTFPFFEEKWIAAKSRQRRASAEVSTSSSFVGDRELRAGPGDRAIAPAGIPFHGSPHDFGAAVDGFSAILQQKQGWTPFFLFDPLDRAPQSLARPLPAEDWNKPDANTVGVWLRGHGVTEDEKPSELFEYGTIRATRLRGGESRLDLFPNPQYANEFQTWWESLRAELERQGRLDASGSGDHLPGAGNKSRILDSTSAGLPVADKTDPLQEHTRHGGPPSTSERYIFSREGETWKIAYGDYKEFRLIDRIGLHYIAYLLRHPQKDFSSLELVSVIRKNYPNLAGNAKSQMTEAEMAEEGIAADTSGAGEAILDEQAKANYKSRLEELSEERLQATATQNSKRIGEIDKETEQIGKELRAAKGLAGRDRTFPADEDRARQAVRKAIKNAMEKIGEENSELQVHLETTIQTGTRCSYRPDPKRSIPWQF